jgi:hypothetical protein
MPIDGQLCSRWNSRAMARERGAGVGSARVREMREPGCRFRGERKQARSAILMLAKDPTIRTKARD